VQGPLATGAAGGVLGADATGATGTADATDATEGATGAGAAETLGAALGGVEPPQAARRAKKNGEIEVMRRRMGTMARE
jgi:hypothetical protein